MIPSPGALGGTARSRLLPPSVPFRYFGAAVVFHVLAWVALFTHAGSLAAFEGGLGPAFASLHLVTLGVLAMTAVGATMQLLPVATRQPVRSVAAAKLIWWLLIPGVVLLTAGAATYAPLIMASGTAITVGALSIYGWLLAENLRRARGMRIVVRHGWAALSALVLLAASALALVAHYALGLEVNRAAFAAAHLVLATYGFMGMLVMGLSHLLLPMFALSPAPDRRAGELSLAMATGAVAIAVVSLLAGWYHGVAFAAVAGLAAVALHVHSMERALSRRMKPALGGAFVMIRVAWGMQIASLAVATALALGYAPAHGAALFGVLLVPGWLLTFVLAALQRIVPFLASVHATGAARGIPSTFTAERLLVVHRVLHLSALAGLVCALTIGPTRLVWLAAAAGLGSAFVFAVFFITALTRLRGAQQAPSANPDSVGT